MHGFMWRCLLRALLIPTMMNVFVATVGSARTIEVNPSTLTMNLASAEPGDEVVLRAGTYGQLNVPRSGIVGKPITIRAYPGEIPVISGLASSVALWLEGRSYIVIDGLGVKSCMGFGHVYSCDHIVIQNCTFDTSTGTGTSSGLKFDESRYCKVMNSTFISGGGDTLLLQDNSNFNLIQGNSFQDAGHSLISIRCSSSNVIRGNTLSNTKQKALEIFDCEAVSDAPFRLDDTKRNVIEGNSFVYTRADTDDHSYNGIQHCGQNTIVRGNVFRSCLGGGVNYQRYSDEALNTYANRMYNNTFYNNRCHGIIGDYSYVAGDYYDNQVKNNLLYKNVNCTGGGDQIRIEDSRSVILANNALATQDPKFVNEAENDLRLSATSPHINKGIFVTKTVSAGSGASLQVQDASYFYDGYGIAGELGDLIQLEGQTARARITAIDYATNTLTLDRPLTWNAAQGVHLAYSGSAPDMGAYEYGLETGIQPAPPKNLRLPK